MFRFKIFISIAIFSFLLVGTSIIKNQTRDIEKKIYNLSSTISVKEKDFYESQLDFFYLTSPSIIENKINHLDRNQYFPMEISKIYLSISNFIDLEKKVVTQERINEKKTKKK